MVSLKSKSSSLIYCCEPKNRIESASSHTNPDNAGQYGRSSLDTTRKTNNAQCGFEKGVCFCHFLAILSYSRFQIRKAFVLAHSLDINNCHQDPCKNELK